MTDLVEMILSCLESEKALSSDVLVNSGTELFTVNVILNLLQDNDWSPKQLALLDKICRKIDISGNLWVSYDENLGSPRRRQAVSSNVWNAATTLMMCASEFYTKTRPSIGLDLKFLGSAMNAFTRVESEEADIYKRTDRALREKLSELSV
jgi:hypothetical protein